MYIINTLTKLVSLPNHICLFFLSCLIEWSLFLTLQAFRLYFSFNVLWRNKILSSPLHEHNLKDYVYVISHLVYTSIILYHVLVQMEWSWSKFMPHVVSIDITNWKVTYLTVTFTCKTHLCYRQVKFKHFIIKLKLKTIHSWEIEWNHLIWNV